MIGGRKMSLLPYTNEEVVQLERGAIPARGVYCAKCGNHIPSFSVLSRQDEAHLRSLDIISAIRELRAKTGCGVTLAKIWAVHPDGPHLKEARPPCHYCGRPLRSLLARQCFECGWDWHDASHPVQHVVKRMPIKSATANALDLT